MKKLLCYFGHAMLGSMVAVSTFAMSFAATPEMVDEDAKLAAYNVASISAEATQDDMNYLVTYMDDSIMEVVSSEQGSCTPSEYLAAYTEMSTDFEEVVVNYFEAQ